jgi:hypothetical protein
LPHSYSPAAGGHRLPCAPVPFEPPVAGGAQRDEVAGRWLGLPERAGRRGGRWRCRVEPHSTQAPSLAVTAALRRRHAGVQYGFVRLRTVAQMRQREPCASRNPGTVSVAWSYAVCPIEGETVAGIASQLGASPRG